MDAFTTPSPANARPHKKNKAPRALAGILILAVAVVALLAALPPFVTIPAGHTGVVTTFGKVAEYTLGEGFHLKNPIQKIVIMDNRTQKNTLELQAFSSDIQQVDVICSANYRIDRATAQNLYKNVGSNYYATVMEPRLLESIKAAFTGYNAEMLMEVRDRLSLQIKDRITPEMKDYGIDIISISIENIDFTDAFTDAVEAKQVAEQTKLKVETEQAQQVSIERSDAERRIIAANADAQQREILAKADASVKRVQADAAAYAREVEAKAEAEANAQIAVSLTDRLIEYFRLSRWNGQLPEVYAGDGALPILDLTPQPALDAP